MIKAHKATNQARFLLLRKLTVEGFGESEWDDNLRANAELDPFCCSKIPPMKK